jgi:hypothetical protein
MTTRKILLVLKDTWNTQLMQDAGLIEPSEFVGGVNWFVQMESHWHLDARDIMGRSRPGSTDQWELVGVVIPDATAYFSPGHEVYGDDGGQVPVEVMASNHRAVMLTD